MNGGNIANHARHHDTWHAFFLFLFLHGNLMIRDRALILNAPCPDPMDRKEEKDVPRLYHDRARHVKRQASSAC